ncbi:sushi domain-containing protein 5 [Takifugu flavidus]|uniref:sushi domain-containing protein 5 n=1 Tax=Takifugu flavidus TaxID=433684 RepID=UPI0025441452|nr:sushi domain-containing protein 5 [Takifugu flavidus]
MRDRNEKLVLLFGCLSCLAVASVVNADGRLFVLNLENSTGLMGFREAERACASLPARLASSAELRHAVVECFFSTCTRGWLYGGTVGTTVCNVVGGVLKAVDVKTENATGDAVNLNAFCIKDRGVPCGDPPSFPNARLQEHSGYEMGDELLYTCVPGYVMPSGHKAFSLLCDSCGEWYGMVEICVRDETEGHVDYEDKFPDTYRDGEDREQRAVEARGEVLEEVHAAAHTEGDPSQQHQETTFTVEQARRHMEGGDEEERTIGDFIGLPMPEQEPGVTADEATDAPVSLLSQKHMFWFPSEAFQDDVTQRDSTVQSEESKENESQELNHSQKPIQPDDLEESDRYVYHDTDDHDDHREGHHDADDDHPEPHPPAQHEDLDRLDHPRNEDNADDHYDMGEHDEDHGQIRYDGHDYDERDDAYNEHESYEDHEDVTEDHGDEEPLDDSLERPDHEDNEDDDGDEDHYNQKEDDDDHYTNTDDHDDHDDDHDAHDEHDEDNDDHVDHDDHDDPADHDDDDGDDDHNDHDGHDHHDHDDHDHNDRYDHDDDQDDPVDDHVDDDLSDDHHDIDHDDDEDHHDHHHGDDDHDDPLDLGENDDDDDDDDDRRTDQDGHYNHGDHKDGDHNSYEDQASQEDIKDSDYHVIFSITRDHRLNLTEMADGGKATTDETWLDGYPVVATETENRDSLVERSKDEGKDMGVFNEVQSHKPGSHISLPDQSKSPSKEPVLEQAGGQKLWPGFIPTTTPTSDREQAPTYSWINDLTQQSFVNHDPAPLGPDGVTVMEDHTMHNLPGESGERGEMGGKMGEMGCTGENCPPPASSGQSPKVAAIIVVVCLVAIAVMVGVWCYRRQQQKSSVYEMNGKGQSQSRPAQQMEMQQKV